MKMLHDWTFSWQQIGILKLTMFSGGLVLGIYFADSLRGWLAVFITVFVIGCLYFLRFVVKENSKEEA